MSKLFDLSGKVAIVTGGNGGIGRAIAIGLAQHGADIVVAARNERKTTAVVDEIRELGRRAVGVRCDVLERADIDRTVATAVRDQVADDRISHQQEPGDPHLPFGKGCASG